jgi:hypothetical protein
VEKYDQEFVFDINAGITAALLHGDKAFIFLNQDTSLLGTDTDCLIGSTQSLTEHR